MTAKPMDPERLAILRARYSEKGWMIQDPNARDFVRDLLAAHDYHAQQAEESRQEIAQLRARVTVVASDVCGIDPGQVIGYMRSTGWVLERVVITHEWKWCIMHRDWHGMDVPTMGDAPDYTRVLASLVNSLATIEGRPGLDIVDAIRATDATP